MSDPTVRSVVEYGNASDRIGWPGAVEMAGMDGNVKQEAQRDAARILRATWAARSPIEPVSIAHALGVEVLETEMDSNTLGALLKGPDSDPKIVLNQRDSPYRRRLTCAHELGHYVRRSAESTEYAGVDLRSSTHENPDELYADEFAACLLMPEDEVRAFVDLGMDDLEMALQFNVLREAMQSRLRSLGISAPRLRVA